MHFRYFLAAGAASLTLACALVTPVMAQETTSTIRGVVTSEGAPVPGATVTITHVPSNTTQTVTSSADGSFVANGLRVGGSYRVTIAADGFESTQVTDVFTALGAAYNLPVSLNSTGPAIVVTAARLPGAGVTVSASNTVLDAEAISNVATVNRDGAAPTSACSASTSRTASACRSARATPGKT